MQPLLYAALALAVGIAAAASAPVTLPAGWAAAAAMVLAAASVWALARGRRRGAAILGLALCGVLGYARTQGQLAHPPAPGPLLQWALAAQSQPRARVFVTGYLRDAPAPLYDGGRVGALRLDLEATSLSAGPADARITPAGGGLRLYAYPPENRSDPQWDAALLRLPAGAGLAASVHLRPPRQYHDPGVGDFGAAARRSGIAATATLPLAGWRAWPVAGRAGLPARARAALWGWLSAHLDQLAPPARRPQANALLRGMLLGDEARLDPATRTNLQVDGVFHLVVVAGLHIGVLAAALWWLLRWLGLRRDWTAGLTLLLLAAYAWSIAGRTPTLRALLMLTLYFGARLWFRERQGLNAVGAAALVLLLWRPLDLYSAGFQMSLGAALLLAGVAHPLLLATSHACRQAARDLPNRDRDEALPPPMAHLRLRLRTAAERLAELWRPLGTMLTASLRLGLYVFDVILISFILQLGLAGFQTAYFHRANPWTVLANALLVPAAAVLIPLGWLGVVLVAVLPAAAAPAGAVVGGGAQLLLAVAAWLARWPAAGWRVPSPPGWFWLLFGAAVGGWVAACTRTGAGPRAVRAWRWVAAASAAVASLAVLLALAPFPARLPPGLAVTILDVGQGDSMLVTFPHGRTLLVDGGPRSARWDTGEQIVAPFLWSLGLRHIDAVLLTHAHNDHLGGLAAVVADFHPAEVWVTRTLPADAPTQAFLRQVAASGARLRRVETGDIFRVGDDRLSVLLPAPGYHAGAAASNDDSMVVRIAGGGGAMLLEGDAEAVGEHWMLDHHLELASSVLKVGHHGSRTSSTPQFLAAVHPQAAVISVGADNSYGHPSPLVLEQLQAAGARVFRTDRDGAVECRLAAGKLQVYLFRPVPGR
jgi:competence protein ComEC